MASFSSTYPAQRPVFTLDAANAGRLDSRMTFTRSDTPPTYAAPSAVHFWSNEKHLSSENLVLQSSSYNTTWSELRLDLTGSQTDPSGGTGAWKLAQQSGQTNAGEIYQYVNVTAARHVLSFYAKAGTNRNFIQLTEALGNGTAKYSYINLSTGAAATVDPSHSFTVTAVGSTGWYRISVPLTPNLARSAYIKFKPIESDASVTVTDNQGFIYLWGVQLEQLDANGPTPINQTTTQIHRAYAPTLKSVATAGQPRFEYDPASDGQSVAKGILIEGSATNLATYSSDITQSFFSAYQSNRDSNVAIAPDGTLTADLLRDDSSSPNTDHSLYWTYSSGGATPQTISFYAKAAGRTHVKLRFSVTSDGVFPGDDVYFDVENGAVGTTDSDITASVENCGNGWFRCIATRTAQASGVGQITLYLANANGSFTYSGDSYSGVLLWGIQIEANASFASSLISSNGSATTRAAESLSVAMADVGVSQGPVSAVVEGSAGSGSTPHLISLSDGTTVNRWAIYRDSLTADTSTDYRLFVRTDNSSVVSKVVSGSASATKFAMRIDTDNFAVCADGGTVETDTAGVAPVTTTIHIADDYNGGNQANGHIKRLALYGDLSDTNLQALTS